MDNSIPNTASVIPLTLLLYCKLSKASAFGPWRPTLQQPLFANMWGARRLLRTYSKTENNESEFSLPHWLALVPTMYLLDATTRNSALTRRRDTYFRYYVWRKIWPKCRSDDSTASEILSKWDLNQNILYIAFHSHFNVNLNSICI